LAARAFEIDDASLQLRDTLRLQEKDLAFEISQARGLRGLDIFKIFESLEASQECFDIRRVRVEEGFETPYIVSRV
jgi:hypothetical protein